MSGRGPIKRKLGTTPPLLQSRPREAVCPSRDRLRRAAEGADRSFWGVIREGLREDEKERKRVGIVSSLSGGFCAETTERVRAQAALVCRRLWNVNDTLQPN